MVARRGSGRWIGVLGVVLAGAGCESGWPGAAVDAGLGAAGTGAVGGGGAAGTTGSGATGAGGAGATGGGAAGYGGAIGGQGGAGAIGGAFGEWSTSFGWPDGSDWPEFATVRASAATLVEVRGGRGCLRGRAWDGGDPATGLTRLVSTTLSKDDFDVVVRVRFERFQAQGFGLYGRQNGGYLDRTSPPGLGYAVFVEGGYQDVLGLWYELDGVERRHQAVSLASALNEVAPLEDTLELWLRYQVVEAPAGITVQRARVWRPGSPEPMSWQVESDATDEEGRPGDPRALPSLQAPAPPRGFALDLFNYSGAGEAGLCLDDLFIQPL